VGDFQCGEFVTYMFMFMWPLCNHTDGFVFHSGLTN